MSKRIKINDIEFPVKNSGLSRVLFTAPVGRSLLACDFGYAAIPNIGIGTGVDLKRLCQK